MTSEWMTNQHRDSYASFIGHAPLLSYFSVAENECTARVKFNLMEVCIGDKMSEGKTKTLNTNDRKWCSHAVLHLYERSIKNGI